VDGAKEAFLGLKPQAEPYYPFRISPTPLRRDCLIRSRQTFSQYLVMNYSRVKKSHRPLRDGSRLAHVPGNELPGYDHAVPPGRAIFCMRSRQ
jgi:hypothetical protein